VQNRVRPCSGSLARLCMVARDHLRSDEGSSAGPADFFADSGVSMLPLSESAKKLGGPAELPSPDLK
jgi:hypothetical protein